jgi:hypothetical protein
MLLMQSDSLEVCAFYAHGRNPAIRRFINQDVLLDDINPGISLNRFAYANGNPISLMDPFGLCAEGLYDNNRFYVRQGYYSDDLFFDTGLPETEGIRTGAFFLGSQPYTVYSVKSLAGLQETTWDLMSLAATAEGIGGVADLITSLTRGEFAADAAELRMMKMPNYPSDLGPGVLGSTDVAGNVTIADGLSWEVQAATLRQESVHAFFSVKDDALFATARQNLGIWAYENSQLARFTEEAIAETYGLGSLLQGLAHPFVNGYGITAGGLIMESAIYGGAIGGVGYLGYRIGGGQ